MLTVVTPASDTKLTSVSNLKLFLGINDNSQDAFLELLIKRASDKIFSYIGRPIVKQTYKEEIPGTDLNMLMLSVYPLISINSIKEKGTIISDYEIFDKATSKIRRNNDIWLREGFYTGNKFDIPVEGTEKNTYEIEYIAGYDLEGMSGGIPLPLDLEEAITEMAKSSYLSKSKDSSVSSESVQGVYSVSYQKTTSGMSASITSVLDKYRSYD